MIIIKSEKEAITKTLVFKGHLLTTRLVKKIIV